MQRSQAVWGAIDVEAKGLLDLWNARVLNTQTHGDLMATVRAF